MTAGVGTHCDGDVCVTCGDVADPMTILQIDESRELALCETETGERLTIEIALVQPVAVGESILVHAGTAIANLGAEALGLVGVDAPLQEPRHPGREAEEVTRFEVRR